MNSRALGLVVIALLGSTTLLSSRPVSGSDKDIVLARLGSYASGVFNGAGSEIAAFDARSSRLFITNIATRSIDIVDISDPSAPFLVQPISLSGFGLQGNSVAVHDGLVAVAVQSTVKTDPGRAVFFDVYGTFLGAVTVGALPDMIAFTPDGRRVLVANEGEPDPTYSVDPEGSVSIIDLPKFRAVGARGFLNGWFQPGTFTPFQSVLSKKATQGLTQAMVRTVHFRAFNGQTLDPSIRIFGPNATVAQDLEPEYVTVSDDSRTAWVTLQENNAIAQIDIDAGLVTRLTGLGFKNHALAGAGLDGSDRDGPANAPAINIAQRPVLGMYLPDAISSFRVMGKTYLVTANEGDARDYPGVLTEEARVSALSLDPATFPTGAVLKTNAQIGRLTVSTVGADTDGDGDVDRLLSLGGRSFSIWTTSAVRVFDSGDAFEQITAAMLPTTFNSDNAANNSFDTRSDNKGPEPEGVAVSRLWGRWYAFIALERVGGVMVYDVTEPADARFVQYINTRNFAGDPAAGTAGDLGSEGIFVIPGEHSPTHAPLLVVANEISGTMTIYAISKAN